ncbi:response regulator [Massilia sp. W12]|uniref:response regulator n=1 Tax=Massilia sp. W12 TaxID=3126507 RepID=UPI0030D2B1DF
MQVTSKPTVLIVDDAADNLMLISMLLQDRCQVIQADSGPRALQMARALPHPDLILLDVLMPEMDGYAVCAELQADPELAQVPVIFLTSRNQEEDQRRGFMAGAADYITKPINPDVLQARVATHLQLSHLRRQCRQQHLALLDILGPAARALLEGGMRQVPPHAQTVQRIAAALNRQLLAMRKPGLDAEQFALLHDAIALLECEGMHWPQPAGGAANLSGSVERLLQLSSRMHAMRHSHFAHGDAPAQGLALPLRIWQTAHALAQLTSERDLKPALELEQALAVLTRASGAQFDPELTHALHALQAELPQLLQPGG